MPKVWNKRDPNTPPDAVYVGRPTKWGNPYVIDRHGERHEVIELYRLYIKGTCKELEARLELRGKDLVCWCAPRACHADILLEIANAE